MVEILVEILGLGSKSGLNTAQAILTGKLAKKHRKWFQELKPLE